jgi:hypothetical protein
LSYGWEIRGKRSSGKTGRSGMRDTGKEQGDPEWRPRRDIGRFGRERRNRAEIYGDPGKKRPERGGGERDTRKSGILSCCTVSKF